MTKELAFNTLLELSIKCEDKKIKDLLSTVTIAVIGSEKLNLQDDFSHVCKQFIQNHEILKRLS